MNAGKTRIILIALGIASLAVILLPLLFMGACGDRRRVRTAKLRMQALDRESLQHSSSALITWRPSSTPRPGDTEAINGAASRCKRD